jgi:hypothetical protein
MRGFTMAATDIRTPSESFSLPMTVTISIAQSSTKSVAHALELDLVSEAPTREDAVRKLRTAIKHHIEFGLTNDLGNLILCPAPSEFWDLLTPNSSLCIGEPIEINTDAVYHHRIATFQRLTTDESERSLITA